MTICYYNEKTEQSENPFKKVIESGLNNRGWQPYNTGFKRWERKSNF
jgi:hypothetical protein